jgi:hypothetical protein
MKILTKSITNKIPALYSTEKTPLKDKKIQFKLFTPWANWTWFIVEGELQKDGDWLFWGLVHGQEKEWGYFTLSDLMKIKGPAGLRVERDLHFGTPTAERYMK